MLELLPAAETAKKKDEEAAVMYESLEEGLLLPPSVQPVLQGRSVHSRSGF